MGRAIALELAREGAVVALCARNKDEVEAACGDIAAQTDREPLGIVADVTIPGDIARFVTVAATRFGGVDLPVNNAGRATPRRYVWLSLAVGAVFVSAGAITMGQAFAALHDVMVRDAERRPGFVNALIRSAFSFGFVLGPLLGSELAALLSFRAAFVVAGCLNLLCLVPLAGVDVPVATDTEREPAQQGRAQSTVPLYVFVGVCTLVLMGTALRITCVSVL